jgi:hypothetical protein
LWRGWRFRWSSAVVVLLDLPAHAGDRDQFRDRCGGRCVRQEQPDVGRVADRAAISRVWVILSAGSWSLMVTAIAAQS